MSSIPIKMLNSTTIIFAYRDRDFARVKLSLQSLQNQTNTNFKVLFIDYGSTDNYAKSILEVVKDFNFVTYYYVGHPGLLWNKSKALNFGIKNTKTDYVITADVDVLFTNDFIETVSKLNNPRSFSLFKIGYLSKQISKQQQQQLLKNVHTTHVGFTFGIGLYPTSILKAVGGLDEFFHFYGSEDEDLNSRVKLEGLTLKPCSKLMLYHQWHSRYPQKKDEQLTITPRLTNILRVNQCHFLYNKNNEINHPNSAYWGNCFFLEDADKLKNTKAIIKLKNIAAFVTHFFEEELPNKENGIYKIIIEKDPYYMSLKYKLKQFLKMQSQPYISMKTANDMILKEIVFNYRNMNYSYSISDDLKQISFSIDLQQ